VAGASVDAILRRLSKQRVPVGAIVLSSLILLEYWAWPFPTREPEIPAFYHRLAAESGAFAVVDLPITNDLSKRYMYYQTVHGKPTVTGHVSRPPEGAYDFIESNDLLRSMWEDGQPDWSGDPASALNTLADAGVRYLIAHRDALSEEELAALEAYLPQSPLLADDHLVVYQIAPLP
jgi:hypothetical protein